VVLLLDSRTIPPADRIEAVTTLLNTGEVPMTFRFGETSGDTWQRVHFLDLNHGIHALSAAGTEFGVRRSRRARATSVPERTALTFRKSGVGRFETPFCSQALTAGEIFLCDQTSDWDSNWLELGGDQTIVVDNDRLQLPVDVVRKAVPNLRRSPVYPLARAHWATARDLLENLGSSAARAMLAASTTDLLRALIITAAGEDIAARDALVETLLSRVDRYIELNLNDSHLTPESIAHANNISVRQLYKVWPGDRPSIAESIIRARLEGVKSDMCRAENRGIGLSALARRWGFIDPSHFGRRFRRAYAMTPSEFRGSIAEAAPASQGDELDGGNPLD
jgi:AraC-like DNA-binding protein